MFKPFVIFLLFSGVSVFVVCSYALMLGATAPKCGRQISPQIVADLKDIIDLVPTVVIDELIAKHYIIDGEFRTALKFVRSRAFAQFIANVQQTDEVCDILVYLHLTNYTQIGSYKNELRFLEDHHNDVQPTDNDIELVLLDRNEREGHTKYAYNRSVGTFNTFVRELCDHLPRSDYVRVISEKRLKSPDFNEFYKALRSADFKAMIDSALKSPNLASAIKTLKNNALDPYGFQTIAFEVISWGPAV